jgi:hypothetical protein
MSTAPIVSVYDGQHLLGHIVESDREHVARTWPDEIFIGAFRTRKEAFDAISEAHKVSKEPAKAGDKQQVGAAT